MKRIPTEARVRERMAPGRLSRDGFLGTDSRNLDEIIAEDLAALDAAGITPDQLADFLDELHEMADQALEGERVLCDGAIAVQETEGMGRIPCPFACGARAHKGVLRIRSGATVWTVTPLHSHLIRAHGFFQGRGSVFRVEPADLVALYQRCRGGAPDAGSAG